MIRNFGAVNVDSLLSRDLTFQAVENLQVEGVSSLVDDEQFSEAVRSLARTSGNLPQRSLSYSRSLERPIDVDGVPTEGDGYAVLGVLDGAGDVLAVSDFSVDGRNVYARWEDLATLSVASELNGVFRPTIDLVELSTEKAISAASLELHKRLARVDDYLKEPFGFLFEPPAHLGASLVQAPSGLFGFSPEQSPAEQWKRVSDSILLALSWAPEQVLAFPVGTNPYDPSQNYVFSAVAPPDQADFRLPINTGFRGVTIEERANLADPDFDASTLTELQPSFRSGTTISSFPVVSSTRLASRFAAQALSKAAGVRSVALARVSALLASIARNSASQSPDVAPLVPRGLVPFVQDQPDFIASVYGGVSPSTSPSWFEQAPPVSFASGFIEPTRRLQPSRTEDGLTYYRAVLTNPEIRFVAGEQWIDEDRQRLGDLTTLNSILLSTSSAVASLEPLSNAIGAHLEMVAMEATSLLGIVRRREGIQEEIEAGLADAEAARRQQDQRIIEANQLLAYIESVFAAAGVNLTNAWTPVTEAWQRDFVRLRGFQSTDLVRRRNNRLASVDVSQVNRLLQDYWVRFGGDSSWGRSNIRIDVPTPLDDERSDFGSFLSARIGSDSPAAFIRDFRSLKILYRALQQADADLEERTRVREEALRSRDAVQADRDRNVQELEEALRRTLLTLLEERGGSDLAARRGKSALLAQIMLNRTVEQMLEGPPLLLERIAAWTYTIWCNGNRLMNNPLESLTASNFTFRELLQRSVTNNASTFSPTAFSRLLENETASVVPVVFSEFPANFLEVTPDLDPLRYLAFKVIDPFFSLLDNKRSFTTSASSRWLNVDQPTLWTLAVYAAALTATEAEEDVQQSLYSSTGSIVRVVTDGRRVALRVPVSRTSALLTRKTLPEQRMIAEVARPMDDYLRAVNRFYGALLAKKQASFQPLASFLERVSRTPPIDLEQIQRNQPLPEDSTPEQIIRASWQVVGGATHSISRSEVFDRLVRAEAMRTQADSDGLIQQENARSRTRFRRQSSFAVLRRPDPVDEVDLAVTVDVPGRPSNKSTESLFLRGLDLLLRQVGFGSIDPSQSTAQELFGGTDTDKVFAVGTPRDYDFWGEAPANRIGLDWTSLLNLSSMDTDFVFDTGLWATPKSADYFFRMLPSSRLPTSLEGLNRGLLDRWWDFWCVEGDSVKKLSYQQAIARYAPVDTPGTFRAPAVAFARSVIVNHVLSESLRLWLKASWSTDFTTSVLRGLASAPLVDTEPALVRGFSESAFSRVWLLPWSKTYTETGRSPLQATENLVKLAASQGIGVAEIAQAERSSAVTVSEVDVSMNGGALRGYYPRPGSAFTGSATRTGDD